MPELKGFSHIDLTVSDRERAAAWWQDVMGFTVVSRWRGDSFDVITLMHPSGLVVSVITHDVPGSGAFDERRIGLDHIAFQVADRDELQRWMAHLEAKGIAQSGIADMSYGPTLVFRDPDNIQLELFVTPLAELAGRAIAEADLASSDCPGSSGVRDRRPATNGPLTAAPGPLALACSSVRLLN